MVEAGSTVLDAAVGGTGGCPFAPKATGNIATKDSSTRYTGRATKQGYLDALTEVAGWLSGQLGNSLPSQVHGAGNFEPVVG